MNICQECQSHTACNECASDDNDVKAAVPMSGIAAKVGAVRINIASGEDAFVSEMAVNS